MLGRKEPNSQPATLAQVKDILEMRSTEPDFGYEQQTCLDYANSFCKLKLSDAKKLFEQLKTIEELTDECAIKIVDMLPQFKTTVQVILAKDKLVLDDSKLERILEMVKKASVNKISPPPKPKEESTETSATEEAETEKKLGD